MQINPSGDEIFDQIINDFLASHNLKLVEVEPRAYTDLGWYVEVTLYSDELDTELYFTQYHNINGYGFTCDSFESFGSTEFWGIKQSKDGEWIIK